MRRGIPLFERLEVETQSHCNRACWFCPRIHDRSGVYLDPEGEPVIKQMGSETVLDILDQAQALGFEGGASFFFYSEPLLDKRCLFFAREARQRGMKPFLHTNGDTLKNNDPLCRQVCEIFHYVVVGIYDYKTEPELDAQQAFWRERLPECDLRFSTIGEGPAGSAPSMATPRALVPTDKRFAVPDFAFDNAPCHRPLIRLIFRYDGEMCMCCEDTQSDFGLGNIHSASLEALWYSDKHIRLVNELKAGRRQKFALCGNCPLPPSVVPADGSRISFRFREYDKQ